MPLKEVSTGSVKKKDTNDKYKKAVLAIHYPEPLPTIYANHVQIIMSNWDISFDFGMVDLRPSGEEAKNVSIQYRTIMSPMHAKVFANMLSENIKKYEEIFGAINVVTPKD